jgi:hypothetical protein
LVEKKRLRFPGPFSFGYRILFFFRFAFRKFPKHKENLIGSATVQRKSVTLSIKRGSPRHGPRDSRNKADNKASGAKR